MGRYKRYSAALKAKVALEAILGEKTDNELAGLYQVHPAQVGEWKKRALEGMPDLFEDRLHIPQIVNQIGEDHDVKLRIQAQLLSIGLDEPQMRVLLPRPAEHLGRDVDANAFRGIDGGEKIALGATDLEDALAGRDQEPEDLSQSAVIPAAQPLPAVAPSRHLVPVPDTLVAKGGGSRVGTTAIGWR